jgi:hypothetical protein
MHSFRTQDAEWHFVGPDPERDVAEQLAEDLWALSRPAAVGDIVARVGQAVREVHATSGTDCGPEALVKAVLDCLHSVAAELDRLEIGTGEFAPSSAAARIADGFATHAQPDAAAEFLARLVAAVEMLALQVGSDTELMALLVGVAVTIDAPLYGHLDGFFETHDTALRELFTRMVGQSGSIQVVDAFFDAQLAVRRAGTRAESGQSAEAKGLLSKARDLYLDLGLRVEAATCDRLAALEARQMGNLEEAFALVELARGTLGEFGAQHEVGLCHLQTGVLMLDRGEVATALAELETAMGIFSDLCAWRELELGSEICSHAAEEGGDMERALAMARLAYTLCDIRAGGRE